jgi:hypothetical protein
MSKHKQRIYFHVTLSYVYLALSKKENIRHKYILTYAMHAELSLVWELKASNLVTLHFEIFILSPQGFWME